MKRGKKISLLTQLINMFIVIVLVAGVLTHFVIHHDSKRQVATQTEQYADRVYQEVEKSIKEYQAYKWLLTYWYHNADQMDIDYDAKFEPGTKTQEQCRLLLKHQPGLNLRYVTQEQVNQLPPEDQKLYAEIAYSWLITRVNEIKQSQGVSFLFCVVTDENYQTQYFLFSAAEEDSVRGTNYEEVYTIGVKVSVSEVQSQAMRAAKTNEVHLAEAGDYVDYYAFLEMIGHEAVLIGMTYDVSALNDSSDAQTMKGTAIAASFQIIVSLLCLLMTFLLVIRPIRRVQKGIHLYEETKDAHAVAMNFNKMTQRNEIGELADDIVALAREIDEYIKEITTISAEKQRIDTELNMARLIQVSMMPSVFPPFPDRHEFDIYATMEPAKSVGGDFYDFYFIDEDHFCLVIADVSGKGIPAALFMMVSKVILQSCAMLGKRAGEILTLTNDAICSSNEQEMFVTIWIGILELSTGKLRAANAGHEYPVLKQPGGEFALVKDKHGLVIGAMDGIHYREYELQLQPGSKLYIYTDGVPEATSTSEELFGVTRMVKALNRDPEASPEEIIHNVKVAIDDFTAGAEQFDDTTMLCIEYKGKDDR